MFFLFSEGFLKLKIKLKFSELGGSISFFFSIKVRVNFIRNLNVILDNFMFL